MEWGEGRWDYTRVSHTRAHGKGSARLECPPYFVLGPSCALAGGESVTGDTRLMTKMDGAWYTHSLVGKEETNNYCEYVITLRCGAQRIGVPLAFVM